SVASGGAGPFSAFGRQAIDQSLRHLVLLEHGVRAGFCGGAVQLGVRVAGQDDPTEVRVVAADAGDGREPVQQRQVESGDHRAGGGVDMGPSAIRYAELNARLRELGLEVDDWGDVGSPVPETTDEGSPNARYLAPIKAACEQVAALVSDAVAKNHIPLTLGGDHSIAMGTLGGMAKARGPGAALWIDAHGDLNRPSTSPTGNVHGMPLAAALGVAAPE